ncbi:hypothetical protein D3C71_89150 [compost metagenome]
MKKITLLAGLFCCFNIAHAQVATWNGSINSSWNNAANWTWSSGGSGIPGATTDVVIADTGLHALRIFNGDSVSCKNLKFGVILLMDNNTRLNIYGDSVVNTPGVWVSPEENAGTIGGNNFSMLPNVVPATDARLNFYGGTKMIKGVNVYIDKVNIASNDVTIGQDARLMIRGQLKFSKPVSDIEASAVNGNLIVDSTGQLWVDDDIDFSLPSYTQTQIPPHIVTTTRLNPLGGNWPFYSAVMVYDDPAFEGIDGSVQLPIGMSEKSFNPITISQSGGEYVWLAAATKIQATSCTTNILASNEATQVHYQMIPMDLNGNIYEELPSTAAPVQISCTFNKLSINQDVLSGFNTAHAPLRLYHVNVNGCYTEQLNTSESSPTTNNYVTVSSNTPQFLFSNFIIAPQPNIDVYVQNNAAAQINTSGGTLPMEVAIFPSALIQSVNWSIVPVSGAANISTSGVVTASGNGTVWAKAISSSNPALSDSVLITITNQSTSINEVSKMIGFSVSPNPAHQVCNITIEKAHPALTIQMLNILGQSIWYKDFAENELSKGYEVPMQSMPSGVYFFVVRSSQFDFVYKVIKE